MSDFLLGFARALVPRLRAEGQIEMAVADTDRVAAYLAHHLAHLGQGHSALSGVEAALLACPEVHEVYFDLDTLKAIVEDLR